MATRKEIEDMQPLPLFVVIDFLATAKIVHIESCSAPLSKTASCDPVPY